LVVYETGNIPQEGAAELLSKEFKRLGITIPGCLGEKNLAHRFAKIWTGGSEGEAYDVHVSMNCMQLDEISDFKKASGNSRPLAKTDLYYVPYWETAFELECGVAHFAFNEFTEKLLKQTDSVRRRMDSGNHFIWEDGGSPVSQAYNHRNTENGAGIGGVYTPQHLRGKGYGASVVAQLSAHLLNKGHKFCFLFADAKNPISNGIYRKIGYYDVCVYDEIRFK
jgi:RimJ/RimL family protein N-acetyltransferase